MDRLPTNERHKTTVEIPADAFRALKRYCETSGTTLNKAIVDACVASYGRSAVQKPDPVSLQPWDNCVISTSPVAMTAPLSKPKVKEQPRQRLNQVPTSSKGRYAGAAKILVDSLKELDSSDA